jgi:hypothetical protein
MQFIISSFKRYNFKFIVSWTTEEKKVAQTFQPGYYYIYNTECYNTLVAKIHPPFCNSRRPLLWLHRANSVQAFQCLLNLGFGAIKERPPAGKGYKHTG